MRKWVCTALLIAFVAAPAAAQEKPILCSAGYAFATYLEEGGGSAPFGLYASIASSKRVGFEADLAYHRDSEEFLGFSFVLNTFTAAWGPRFAFTSPNSRPFLHALAGLRHDRFEGESNTAAGGMLGAGMDVPGGPGVSLHVGADFQIFLDDGENVKTLRVIGGLTF